MDNEYEWSFCGRYGDERNRVHIQTLPAELPEHLQKALKALYDGGGKEFCDCGVKMEDGYELQKLGLVRQVGNAWHPQLMWAPQVHAFAKHETRNDSIAESLRQQYA